MVFSMVSAATNIKSSHFMSDLNYIQNRNSYELFVVSRGIYDERKEAKEKVNGAVQVERRNVFLSGC